MGGEKFSHPLCSQLLTGSPPHGRGKGIHAVCCTPNNGITPAWAGKSDNPAVNKNDDRDHPRMGGEKLSGCVWLRAYAGSPPHGRGKALELENALLLNGITPAWAGKSYT